MIVTIQEVNIEKVKTGKSPYEKAVIKYSFQGNSRSQTMMSFSNPGVFKVIKEMQPGENYDVTVTKNDAGYNTWAAVKPAGAEAPVAGKPASVTVPKSNYETPEERKLRQLYIIRQSSIANAIELYNKVNVRTDLKTSEHVEYIKEIAQEFVDFVYAPVETSDLFEQDNDLPE